MDCAAARLRDLRGENPERFGFSGACGEALGAPADAEVEERKVVPVLFVDLVSRVMSSLTLGGGFGMHARSHACPQ